MLDYPRLYKYRFRDSNLTARSAVWREIAAFVARRAGNPAVVLDPAAGNLEFLRHVPAKERWGVDLQAPAAADLAATGIKFIQSDIFSAELPQAHFDLAFVSNFLEHLPTPERVAEALRLLHGALKPNGQLMIMGPNFRYCARDYFDCSDHRIALTDVSVGELLYSTQFQVERSNARFLPYSFRGALPSSPFLARTYLRFSALWPLFGKQFLITARRA